jgi:hypothetical protein
MDNLPNLENMMTNFNQIVIQEAIINKLFFCFDLPLEGQPLKSYNYFGQQHQSGV